MYVCVIYTVHLGRGGGPAQVKATSDDETDVRLSETALRRSADAADYNAAAHLLKRLVSGDVAKRRFCRHNYVYNPVSGRCQASLLVRRPTHHGVRAVQSV